MSSLSDLLPAWLATTVIATVFAVLGFFGRRILDSIDERRKARLNALRQLRRLTVLLVDSRRIFVGQARLRNNLMKSLTNRLADKMPKGLGFDETFYQTYEQMNAQERGVFHVIRGTSLHSMHRVNGQLRMWADENTAAELVGKVTPSVMTLDESLSQLRLHLNGWFDIYESLLKLDQRRSLAYLADEKEYGVGFPKDLDNAVKQVIKELQ